MKLIDPLELPVLSKLDNPLIKKVRVGGNHMPSILNLLQMFLIKIYYIKKI
jgi:hypothetical protein